MSATRPGSAAIASPSRRCSSSGRSRAGETTTTFGARTKLERDLGAPVDRELRGRGVVAAVRDAEDRQSAPRAAPSAVARSVSCSPTFPARDDRVVAVDVDGVRRDDDRDVGLGRSGAAAELLHRRAQRRIEVDVAVRRDAGEDEAHGSEAIRETRSSRNRSASTSTPTSAFCVAAGDAAQVDDGAAVAVLRPRLDRDVRAARRHQRRVDHVRDGHRVVDRRAVEAVRALVEGLEEVRQLGDEASGAARVAQPLGVRAA